MEAQRCFRARLVAEKLWAAAEKLGHHSLHDELEALAGEWRHDIPRLRRGEMGRRESWRVKMCYEPGHRRPRAMTQPAERVGRRGEAAGAARGGRGRGVAARLAGAVMNVVDRVEVEVLSVPRKHCPPHPKVQVRAGHAGDVGVGVL